MSDPVDEITTLLRTIVATQAAIVETLAEASDDIADLNRRVMRLENTAASRADGQQNRRLMREARDAQLRSAEFFPDRTV